MCWPSSSCRRSAPMGRDPNTPDWVQHIAFEVKDRADAAGVQGASRGRRRRGARRHRPRRLPLDLLLRPERPPRRTGLPGSRRSGDRLRRLDAVKWDMLEEWSQHQARAQARRLPARAASSAHDRRRSTHTHDAALGAAGSSRPTIRTPTSRSRTCRSGASATRGDMDWRIGVAIGDQVLDLRRAGLIDTQRHEPADAPARRSARARCARRCRDGLRARQRSSERAWRAALLPQSACRWACPARSATTPTSTPASTTPPTVGKLFRPDNPLLPNYKWVPIGYHGRASSIAAPAAMPSARPLGQMQGAGRRAPALGADARLDYELELGIFIGRPNAMGEPIAIAEAEDHVFGLDAVQRLERARHPGLGVPAAGPVPVEELRQHGVAVDGDAGRAGAVPQAPSRGPPATREPLPYLDSPDNRERGAIDIELEVWLQTAAMREAGHARRPPEPLELRRRATGRWRSWSRTTPSTAATCTAATCSAPARCPGRGPDQGGSLLELTPGRQAADHAVQRRDAQLPAKTATRVDPARPLRARRLPPHRLRRVPRHGAAGADEGAA